LSTPNGPVSPRLSLWQPTLFTARAGPMIWIDVPAQHKYAVQKVVPTLGLPGFLAADPPRPSLGNTKEHPRACVHLHLHPNSQTPLWLEMMLPWLQKALAPFQGVVGHIGSVSSPTALLMDCPSPQAAFTHGALCWSSLVMSPTLVLLETRTAATTWGDALTTAWRQDPNTAGERVRYRPSSQHPGVFAQVQATDAQLAAAKARKGHNAVAPSISRPLTLQATLTIPIQTTGHLTTWLPAFMSKAAETCAIPFQPAATDTGLDVHSWRAIFNWEGSWTGKVVIQLANAAELSRVHTRLQGMGVDVYHHIASISVESRFVDFDNSNLHRHRAAESPSTSTSAAPPPQ